MSLETEPEAGPSGEFLDGRGFVRSLPIFAGLDAALLDAITMEIEWFAVAENRFDNFMIAAERMAQKK